MANTTNNATANTTPVDNTTTNGTATTPEVTPEMLKAMSAAMQQNTPPQPGAFFAGIQYTANQLGDTGLAFPDGRQYTVEQILNGIAFASEMAERGLPEAKGWHSWPLWKKVLVGAGIVGGVGFLGYLVYDKYFSSSSGEVYVDVDGTEYDVVDC